MLTRRTFLKSGIIAMGMLTSGEAALAGAGEDKSLFPPHAPLGEGQGIHPGRVVWTHDPKAVHWSGMDFWWKPENYDAERLLAMTRKGVTRLTGEDTPEKAWQALFAWCNAKNGKKGGYKPGQKVAVKVNMNGAGENNDDPHGEFGVSYGNPLLLQALLRSMVRDGGVRPQDIVVFDTCRIFPDHMRKLCTEGELQKKARS